MEFTDEMLWLLAEARSERCSRFLLDGGFGPRCLRAVRHDGPHAWAWADEVGKPLLIKSDEA